jgi:DNA segregation ATPase FtsK/SpoIIIE-like protein
VIDLYSLGELHDTIDGFHPNKSGMKTLANAVLGALKNNKKKEKMMKTGKERLDEMYVEALEYVVGAKKASVAFVQRQCKVGYYRGSKILEWMEVQGYVGPYNGETPRAVFATEKEVEELKKKLEKGEDIGRQEEEPQKCAYEIIYGSEELS